MKNQHTSLTSRAVGSMEGGDLSVARPFRPFLLISACTLMLMAMPVRGQAINWGLEFGESFVTSRGGSLIGYEFVLGAFGNDFTPDTVNFTDLDKWGSNWHTFDAVTYFDAGSPASAAFTRSVSMNSAGGSTSSEGEGGFNFQYNKGYVWLRNSDEAGLGSEWYLYNQDDWFFPAVSAQPCCDPALALTWEVADLSNPETRITSIERFVTPKSYGQDVLSWTLDTSKPDPETDRGYAYTGVSIDKGKLSGGDSIFQIVVNGPNALSEPFWQQHRNWSDIFTDGNKAIDIESIFSSFQMVYLDSEGNFKTIDYSSYGSWSINGSNLSWSAVPEPTTTALGAILIAGGLFRRHRNFTPKNVRA